LLTTRIGDDLTRSNDVASCARRNLGFQACRAAPVVLDARVRDYGHATRRPSDRVAQNAKKHLQEPGRFGVSARELAQKIDTYISPGQTGATAATETQQKQGHMARTRFLRELSRIAPYLCDPELVSP
jgi:hypothetical protein